MEPFHSAGDVHEAQKRDIELVIACGHAAKNLHALEKLRDTLLPKLMSGEVRVAY